MATNYTNELVRHVYAELHIKAQYTYTLSTEEVREMIDDYLKKHKLVIMNSEEKEFKLKLIAHNDAIERYALHIHRHQGDALSVALYIRKMTDKLIEEVEAEDV